MAKNKNPKAKFDPQPSKTPKAGFNENPLLLRPAWRIGSIEMRDPFGWHEIDTNTLHEIRERLKSFETMNIVDFFGPKKPSHAVELRLLCKDARDRLTELRLDGLETLASLRLAGRKRIWAIPEHNVFILLWWDPNHLVCPCLKD